MSLHSDDIVIGGDESRGGEEFYERTYFLVKRRFIAADCSYVEFEGYLDVNEYDFAKSERFRELNVFHDIEYIYEYDETKGFVIHLNTGGQEFDVVYTTDTYRTGLKGEELLDYNEKVEKCRTFLEKTGFLVEYDG